MTDYPFSTILINNREVELKKIVSGEATGQSDFEKHTFTFIKDWRNGETEFRQNTSGSTGTPKEIRITREQMIASARLTEEALHLNTGFTALTCLDTRYIAGKMMLVRCFVTGMKIIAIDPTANPLKEVDPHQQIDFVALVPYQVQEIISSESASRLNNIKISIIGGAAVDHITIKKLQSFRCQCYATYGMTETVSHIALQKLNGLDSSEFFRTVSGIEINVDDRNCLCIKSSNFNEEVITNDIVEILSKTTFRWIGRYDNVINTGGTKVSPEELEGKIRDLFKILKIERSFFIDGIPDKRLGQKLVLFIEGEELNSEIIQELILMFKHYFTSYKVPKEIIFIKHFIFTDSDKLNRRKTIEIFQK